MNVKSISPTETDCANIMGESPGLNGTKGPEEIMSIIMNDAARMLYSMEPLRTPVVQTVISSLRLPQNSRGLDVGCGLGIQTQMLAQEIGPDGHVTGLDFNPSLLAIAKELSFEAGMAGRVSFQQGSWTQIPYEEKTFDWVWSMDGAGYAPYEPAVTIKELARVVKPGGRLVVAYWSAQCLLPGYPELEARLSATPAGIAPFSHRAPPESHYLRTLGWLMEAGLHQTRSETFVRTVSAPLDPDETGALAALYDMRWGTAEHDVSPEDWRAYQRLCRAESVDFLPNCPDYYAFFTYSVFSGVVP